MSEDWAKQEAENIFGKEGDFSFWSSPGREAAIKETEKALSAAYDRGWNEAVEEAMLACDKCTCEDAIFELKREKGGAG